MTLLNFTIENLNALQPPQKGTRRYQDRQNPALSLYITATGVRTFFVRKRITGSDHRIRIGRFPTVSIAQARTQATILAAEIELGRDPVKERSRSAEQQRTLADLCDTYLQRYARLRNKQWKAREKEINLYLKPLLNKRIGDINRAAVERLHDHISKRAPIQANRVIALLRAVFNFAIKRGWDGKNPAAGIEFNLERSRDRFVLPEEMSYLLRAVGQQGSPLMRDFFLMLLYTGCRKSNVQQMRWEQIDFQHRLWRIPETKNGQPQIVPLIGQALDILQQRQRSAESQWVFPQRENPLCPLTSPQKSWERIRAVATLLLWQADSDTDAWMRKVASGKQGDPIRQVERLCLLADATGRYLPPGLRDVRIHDLRRTFGSYQAMTGASLQVIGKSLGHKSLAATQIYARMNLDPVRSSVEKAVELMSVSKAY
ncbi:tyrosine-type recombinase/integrase [Nostoc sp. NIES-2111]